MDKIPAEEEVNLQPPLERQSVRIDEIGESAASSSVVQVESHLPFFMWDAETQENLLVTYTPSVESYTVQKQGGTYTVAVYQINEQQQQSSTATDSRKKETHNVK